MNGSCSAIAGEVEDPSAQPAPAETVIAQSTGGLFLQSLTLEDCLQTAFDRNQRRTVSRYAVALAQAQHRQALSSFWPQLLVNSTFSRMDENPNFVFPEERSQYTIEGLLPVPQTVQVTIPEKDVQVMDRDSAAVSLDLFYPLYTGGVRTALARQAELGIQAAKEEARRTDLEIYRDIRRMYYGLVLAKDLLGMGRETLSRMEGTLDLTEKLYQSGSGSVTKADYLRNRVMVEGIRSAVFGLESNVALAKAALVNTLGLPWDTEIDVRDTTVPYEASDLNMSQAIGDVYRFNPDWNQLETALSAAESKIREEKGKGMPQVALTGSLWGWNNSYNAGLAAAENKEGWRVGIGVQIPLFNGFLTRGRVEATRAHWAQLRAQQVLLREGLALRIQHVVIQMQSFQKQEAAHRQAALSAEENRTLNEKAYQNDLVETKDVIESQLLESFMKALHRKTVYEHWAARVELDFIIGQEFMRRMDLSEGQL